MERSLRRMGQLQAVLVYRAAGGWEVIDGFKRVRAACVLEWAGIRVEELDVDAAGAKLRLWQSNAGRGMTELEEAWLIRSLHREEGWPQVEIARWFGRHKSWVNRRLLLAEGLGGRGAGGRAAGARVGGGRARAVPVAARQPGGGGGGGGTARADEPADRAPGGRVAVHGRSYDASGGAGRADTTRSELPARTERPAAARGRRAHPCRSRAAAAGVRAPASAPARALAGEPRRRGGDPPARGARGSAAGAGRAGRHAGACHENRRRAWISIA